MADEPIFSINFATGRSIDLDEIRKRRSPFMPDGGHAWVISAVYALDNPEAALDEMSLDGENFVGVSGIHCLLCYEEYRSTNRFYKCPQQVMVTAKCDVCGEDNCLC